MLSLDSFLTANPRISQFNSLVVAYSGGVDSHVLLHLLSQLPNVSLLAVHVNHGLSPNANCWEKHCHMTCDSLSIPIEIKRIKVESKPRHSLESVARDMRYAVLSDFTEQNTVLVTGHHQDDQAETVLLQLMRGAGVKGLSGMPVIKSFAMGYCMRPLLNFSRADIIVYAKDHGLQWIEDESNQSDRFDRNFLRQQVIPAIKSRREGVVGNIVRSARHMAEAAELVDALAAIDYELIATGDPSLILRLPLQNLPKARQRNVLRRWLALQIQTVPIPSEAILDQIIQQLVYASPDKHPVVQWKHTGVKLCKMRQNLEIIFNTP